MNALAASAEADVTEQVGVERDNYRATLELVLKHLNSFDNMVGDRPLVSRRIAVGAVEVMAGLIEEALGR